MTDELPEFPKNRGWPKGKKRGPRKSPAPEEAVKTTRSRRVEYDLGDMDDNNRLYINPNRYPDGMDLQWVTDSIYGAHTAYRRASFERKGWEAIHVGDFDGRFDYFMPRGFQGQIEVDGLVLCARPLEISVAARKKERHKAVEQLLIKERQIMGGNIPQVSLDTHHESAVRSNRLNKSWERINVPDDE